MVLYYGIVIVVYINRPKLKTHFKKIKLGVSKLWITCFVMGKIKDVNYQKQFELCPKYEFYLFINKNLGDEPLTEVCHHKNQAFSNVWIIPFGDKSL